MAFIGSSTTPANFQKLEGGIKVTGDNITDGNGNVIFNQSNNHIPTGILQYDGFEIAASKGLTYDSLSDSTGSISLNDSAVLNIDTSDASGKFLSDDGSNQFTLNLGEGIREDPSNAGNIALDETVGFTFTSELTLDAGATFKSDLDANNNNTITNLPSPSDAADAARKRYVDGVAQGLEIKESVEAATDGTSFDLSATQDGSSIDGTAIGDGDRVLLKDQSDSTENGVYDAVTATDTTTWVRSSDFDEDDEVTSGTFTFVRSGTNNGSTSFTVTSSDPISVGTDPILFDQFASAGEIIGGDGLSKSGQELSIAPSDFVNSSEGLQVNSSDIEVNLDSTLETDGSGQISIDESNSLTFTAEQTFSSGIDLGNDITDSTDVIYSSSSNHVPESILEELSNSALTNSSVTVNVNNGIDGGGSVSLGGSVGVSIKPQDFINTSQLSINGSGNIAIDDIFLSKSGDKVTGSFTFGEFFDLEPIAEPNSPSTGNIRVFIDNSDNDLKTKASDGSVVSLVST